MTESSPISAVIYNHWAHRGRAPKGNCSKSKPVVYTPIRPHNQQRSQWDLRRRRGDGSKIIVRMLTGPFYGPVWQMYGNQHWECTFLVYPVQPLWSTNASPKGYCYSLFCYFVIRKNDCPLSLLASQHRFLSVFNLCIYLRGKNVHNQYIENSLYIQRQLTSQVAHVTKVQCFDSLLIRLLCSKFKIKFNFFVEGIFFICLHL